ncbi:MAG: hypothetical protein K0R26_1099 [Bacteroidota bacterium]|nr:hypothetical protein [Bacteroidota bacterium]
MLFYYTIKKFRTLFCLPWCLLFTTNAFSQSSERAKLLKENYLKDSIRIFTPKKIYPQLALDNRKSFIRNSPVDIQGIYTGILYKSRYKFGTGYYQVDAKGHSNTNVRGQETNGIRDLDLYYGTINFEYLIIDRRFIKFGFPINLGFGFSNLNIYDNSKVTLLYHSVGKFVPLSLGSEITLKPLREIGLTTSIGYRKILSRSEPRIDFDGLYYSYGLEVDIKEIIKDIRWLKAKKRYKKALRLK